MLTGAHIILYSTDPEADRAFFQNVLNFRPVDAGHNWLIFALPAAELAVHPDEKNDRQEMYLTCSDLKAEIAQLEKKGVCFTPVTEERWGSRTAILLPGGGKLGLYQPKHPTAF
jgi:catechol 2,3-dioxygenase-like lactoylglutathione lyase family enzyme